VGFFRRGEPLHERLAREGGLVSQPAAPQRPFWQEPGMTGHFRPRAADAIVTADAPDVEGDAVRFVSLPDGSLLVEEGADSSLDALAAAVEQELRPPYRARGVRRGESMWAVEASRIEVLALPDAPDGDSIDVHPREHRFNVGLLGERLVHATKWAKQQEPTRDLRIGYFGSSTGGGAALVAAAEIPVDVGAVVSRGGRPDLAGEALPKVQAPTLLIVGGNDDIVIELNEMARDQMRCEVKLEILPGATHLFEEPGALEKVANLASDWFNAHLAAK